MARKTRTGTGSDVGLWLDETAFALQDDEDEYMQYSLNLGAEPDSGAPSVCPTPPRLRLDVGAVQRQQKAEKKRILAGDCGICFEHAVSPVQVECCSQIFCADHLASWIRGPTSDGLCPACRTPTTHPSIRPSLAAAAAPTDILSPLSTTTAPSTLTVSSALSSSEEEDSTDFSFPALAQARVLQTRRHTSHSLSSVVGLRGAFISLARVLIGVLVVGVLAGRGRWAAAQADA